MGFQNSLQTIAPAPHIRIGEVRLHILLGLRGRRPCAAAAVDPGSPREHRKALADLIGRQNFPDMDEHTASPLLADTSRAGRARQ
jgi:hypothetical protein